MFIWTVTGTPLTAGAILTYPTLSVGSNMTIINSFIGDSANWLSPQSLYNGSSAAGTGCSTMTIISMVQVTASTLTAGQSFIKLAAGSSNWPTSVTSGDVYVMECPSSWGTVAPELTQEEKEEKKEEKKMAREEARDKLMMLMMAKMSGVTIPPELWSDGEDESDDEKDGDWEMEEEKKEAKEEKKEEKKVTPLSPSTTTTSLAPSFVSALSMFQGSKSKKASGGPRLPKDGAS